jgi:hypothetical protein
MIVKLLVTRCSEKYIYLTFLFACVISFLYDMEFLLFIKVGILYFHTLVQAWLALVTGQLRSPPASIGSSMIV